jgi:hypothetical protein
VEYAGEDAADSEDAVKLCAVCQSVNGEMCLKIKA